MERTKTFLRSATNPRHVTLHAWGIALAVAAQLISDTFVFMGMDSRTSGGRFQNAPGNETLTLEVTMDPLSGIYWIGVDLWSKLWLLEAVGGILTRNVLGPQSCNPEIHPPVFYLMWSFVVIARLSTMSNFLMGSMFLRWVLPLLGFSMLCISHVNLEKHKVWLAINSPRRMQTIRFLTQNGLAAFVSLSLLDAVLGFGLALKRVAGVTDPLVSGIVLTIVTLFTITWFVLENFLWAKYLRYTFTVYPVLILGLGAMFVTSYRVNDLTANTLYCGFLMLLMTIMNVVHLVSVCVCSTERSGNPPVAEPYVGSEACKTVYQPDGATSPVIPS